MRTLLIRDKDSSKTVISLSYKVGSFNDPTLINGLAHYLEHVMFLGSKNYPANTLFHEVNKLSGNKNAFTSEKETN